MKIAFGSDLHMEFDAPEFPLRIGDVEADVLVLAGDIVVANDIKKYPFGEEFHNIQTNDRVGRRNNYLAFLEEANEKFDNVIMIAGNHEHYHGKFHETFQIMGEVCEYFGPKWKFLNNDIIEIDDKLFIGTTMWTDFGCNSLAMYKAEFMMNDYRQITWDGGGYRSLSGRDVLGIHYESRKYVTEMLERNKDRDTIVVTHHAPCHKSCHSRYLNDMDLNLAYFTDLTDLMLDNDQLKLWIHGHTHDPYDYEVDNTRVVCNPRGYIGVQAIAESFQLKVVEV